MGKAVVLSSIGGLAVLIGAECAWLPGMIVSALPTHISWLYVVLAEILVALIGILAGVLSFHRAAHLDSIDALKHE